MTEAKRRLIAGNWKMNGLALSGIALAREIAHLAKKQGDSLACDLLICPPATLVREVAAAVFGSGVAVGGQDCHGENQGPFTGDIGAPMLADAGCSYVIVGHSERRATRNETNQAVRAKATSAQAAGLCAIICVGENTAARERGSTLDVVAGQLSNSLPEAPDPAKTVIAYEPVWAIGSGATPTDEEIAEVHRHIHGLLADRIGDSGAIRVIYGGSVNPENAPRILGIAEVDGALIGGASLNSNDYWTIAQSCR